MELKAQVHALLLQKKPKQKPKFVVHAHHIFQLLKLIHNAIGINNQAMSMMCGLMQNLAVRIVEQVADLQNHANARSAGMVTSHMIQFAVRIIMHGELPKYCVAQCL